MSYEIIEKLKQAIGDYKDNEKLEEIGRVIESGDGIVKIYGLKNVKSQEIISIETEAGGVKALALNLEEDSVGALVLDDPLQIKSGDIVKRTDTLLSIEVGESLLGRVVNALGEPLDGQGPIFTKEKSTKCLLEKDAPSVLDRDPVDTPLHTGVKTIDAIIPIGRGQRELIIGDRQTGKSAIAIDTIINQHLDTYRKTPVCIYVAIGQKESKIAKTVETLRNSGALDYTIIVQPQHLRQLLFGI
jgi:F-type H+-transporting ATPase subunit alpha